MRRASAVILLAAALAVIVPASPAPAYVHNTIDLVGNVPVITRWPASAFPIPMVVTPGLTTDVNDGTDRAALDAAMATWSASADSAAAVFVQREGRVEANVFDGINAMEFSNDPALAGAQFLSLSFVLLDPDGTIRESDLLINDREVGFTTTAGSNTGIDLETTMLREMGKFLGLTSSPVGTIEPDQTVNEDSAVMYPVLRGIGEDARALRNDDIAGIASLYPAAGSRRGTITGTVTRAGAPVFGAHVVAHDPVQDILVGAVTLPDGTYTMAGMPAGRYLMEALPITGRVTPASLGGIFLRDDVDTTFRRAFFTQTVRLSAGGTVAGVSVEVE